MKLIEFFPPYAPNAIYKLVEMLDINKRFPTKLFARLIFSKSLGVYYTWLNNVKEPKNYRWIMIDRTLLPLTFTKMKNNETKTSSENKNLWHKSFNLKYTYT